MNTHPVEHLPAYALGALNAEETRRVASHLLVCPACCAEVESFRISIGMGLDCPPPPSPPRHIKHQLMARIRAHSAAQRRGVLPAFVSGRTWLGLLTACSLLLVLTCGIMIVDARRQLANNQAELKQDSLNTKAITAFLSDPATVSQPMEALHAGAHGTMYMQAGQARAVLVVGGLPQLAPGTIYQFWFADAEGQVPSRTFTVDANGLAQAIFDAPDPVDSYAEVMVTVEPTGGSSAPSNQIVLAAKLAA